MRPSDFIKKGWCQHTNAKREDNTICAPYNPMASYWCLIGAIMAAYSMNSDKRRQVINKLTDGDAPGKSIALWNDAPERTQAEVIARLQAIGE